VIFEYEAIKIIDVISDYFLPGLYGSIGGLVIIFLFFWAFVKIVNFIRSLIGVR
jgi:hypothetical protein